MEVSISSFSRRWFLKALGGTWDSERKRGQGQQRRVQCWTPITVDHQDSSPTRKQCATGDEELGCSENAPGVLIPSTSSWAEMASAARQLSNFREQKLLVNEHRNGRGFTHGAQEHQSQLSTASSHDYTAVFLLIFRTVSLSLSRFQKKAS